MARFETRDADGAVLGSYDVCGPAETRSAVDAARAAAAESAGATLAQRVKLLRAWRGKLWRGADQLATLLHRESGMGLDDALFEVVQTVEHLKWVEANAARVLTPSTRGGGLLAPELARRTSYVAEGVVAVVASPFAPLYGPASAVAVALVTGNAVVLKPARTLTATLVAYAEALPTTGRHGPLLQVLPGDDATTAALLEEPLDRVCLFGSAVGSARVVARCATAMVPVTTVPVGPPVTVVAPDADVAAAATSVARAVARAGEGSEDRDGSVPEVYVAPVVSEEFDEALKAALEAAYDVGMRSLGRGAVLRALAPLRSRHEPLALGGAAAAPRVRVHADAEFGDVLQRLSDRPYAQVAVFSREKGDRIGKALRAAQVTINVGASGPDGGLPREALGAQGYGPLGGDDGLRAFARSVTVTAKRRLPVPTTPADLVLATPAGRAAARLAMHLRHSLD